MKQPKRLYLYADSREQAYNLMDSYDVLWITCTCRGVRGDCTTKGQVNDFFNRYDDELEAKGDETDA